MRSLVAAEEPLPPSSDLLCLPLAGASFLGSGAGARHCLCCAFRAPVRPLRGARPGAPRLPPGSPGVSAQPATLPLPLCRVPLQEDASCLCSPGVLCGSCRDARLPQVKVPLPPCPAPSPHGRAGFRSLATGPQAGGGGPQKRSPFLALLSAALLQRALEGSKSWPPELPLAMVEDLFGGRVWVDSDVAAEFVANLMTAFPCCTPDKVEAGPAGLCSSPLQTLLIQPTHPLLSYPSPPVLGVLASLPFRLPGSPLAAEAPLCCPFTSKAQGAGGLKQTGGEPQTAVKDIDAGNRLAAAAAAAGICEAPPWQQRRQHSSVDVLLIAHSLPPPTARPLTGQRSPPMIPSSGAPRRIFRGWSRASMTPPPFWL